MDEDPRVKARAADQLPEEAAAGTGDATAQAKAILEESDERQDSRDDAPDAVVERRTSEEATPPPD
jgi:hypothetical protein